MPSPLCEGANDNKLDVILYRSCECPCCSIHARYIQRAYGCIAIYTIIQCVAYVHALHIIVAS